MSAFSNWDTYNVIAEHISEALQTDSVLGSSGAIEIQTWEAETRDNSADYSDYELPAVAIEVTHSGQEINPLSKHLTATYAALILTTTGGEAVLKTVKQLAKRIAVRIERNIRQQNISTKQFSDVTADLEGAISGSVKVTNAATQTDGGVVNNVMRGAAATTCEIQIDFTPTID